MNHIDYVLLFCCDYFLNEIRRDKRNQNNLYKDMMNLWLVSDIELC